MVEATTSSERNLIEIRVLQKNSTRSVTLYEDTESKKKIVIKKLPKTYSALQEIQALRVLNELNHPNIVKFLDFEEKTDGFYLSFEYCEQGDLGEFIKKNPDFPEHQAQKIIQQIFSGLLAIHDKKLIHCDLKCENIVIDENYTVKIADFGSTTPMESTLKSCVGSPITRAPEVYLGKYNEKCDIWSFGIICYRILCGRYPYPETLTPLKLQELLQKPFQVTFPEGRLSKRVTELVSRMLVQNPNKRISLQELREDDWINGKLFNVAMDVILPDAGLRALSSLDLWYPDTSAAFKERYNQSKEGKKNQVVVLYKFEDKIGESSVYSAFDLYDYQQQVMIKRIPKSWPLAKERVFNEIYILKKLQSSYTVRLIDHLESEEDYFLVYEKCKHGSLESFLRTHTNESRPSAYELYKLILALLESIKGLYSSKLVHGRISLDHILLDADYNLKICGFSEAMCLDETAIPAHFPTEIISKQTQYTPPEMLLHQKRCQNSDFWSWGFVFASILQGQTSFESVQQATLGLPDSIKDLIHFMLQEDPAKRIDIVGVMKHPWVCRMELAKSVLDELYKGQWHNPLEQLCSELLFKNAEDEREESLEVTPLLLIWEKMNNECSNEILDGETANGDFISSKEIMTMGEINYLKVFYIHGATYSGPLKYGKRHGKGEMTFASGERYKGDLRDDKFDGDGEAIMNDGGSYKGKWKDGHQHGQGIFTFPTHSKFSNYEGEWNRGRMVKGKLKWKNGDVYDGELDGVGNPNGKGVFKWAQSELLYNGEWKTGVRAGKGTLIYPNGKKYEGDWECDQMHGRGRFEWENGEIYEGEWKKGVRDGKGKLVYSTGERYEGAWENDKMHGWGEIHLPDTKKNGFSIKYGNFSDVTWINSSKGRFVGRFTTLSGKYYQGEWLRFRKDGFIVSMDADGTIYQGFFSEDSPFGKVTLILPHLEEAIICFWKDGKLMTGDKGITDYFSMKTTFPPNVQRNGKGSGKWYDGIFFGQWKYNQPYGRGRMKYSNKSEFKGEFKDGYRHGNGQEITPEGTKYSGTWEMNKKEGRFIVEYKGGHRDITKYENGYEQVNTVSRLSGSSEETASVIDQNC